MASRFAFNPSSGSRSGPGPVNTTTSWAPSAMTLLTMHSESPEGNPTDVGKFSLMATGAVSGGGPHCQQNTCRTSLRILLVLACRGVRINAG